MNPFSFMLRTIVVYVVMTIVFSGCNSSTTIISAPGEAKIFLNGQYAGKTPYHYNDAKISGSTTNVMIEKEGYETLHTFFKRNEKLDVGALVAGCFFIYPLLWVKKYNPQHEYVLTPVIGASARGGPTKAFKKTVEPLP